MWPRVSDAWRRDDKIVATRYGICWGHISIQGDWCEHIGWQSLIVGTDMMSKCSKIVSWRVETLKTVPFLIIHKESLSLWIKNKGINKKSAPKIGCLFTAAAQSCRAIITWSRQTGSEIISQDNQFFLFTHTKLGVWTRHPLSCKQFWNNSSLIYFYIKLFPSQIDSSASQRCYFQLYFFTSV